MLNVYTRQIVRYKKTYSKNNSKGYYASSFKLAKQVDHYGFGYG